MTSDASPKRTRPVRRLDRIAGLTVILALSLATMPATGLAGGASSVGSDRGPLAVLDVAQLDEALGQGALPVELLMAASLAAIAVGFVLTVLIGTVRRRRLVEATAPVPAAPSADKMDAARAEAWAAREATIEIARETAGWPPDVRPQDESEPTSTSFEPEPLAARAPWREMSETRASTGPVSDTAVIRPALDTLEAPVMAGASHHAASNLSLVVMTGTIAVGVAFSGGAVVGATLGVGVAAAIGLAFAVGAGTAIGATVALLGSHRR